MKTFARTLRKKETDAERLLWARLRNRQVAGHKFRRQETIGPYVADFVCLAPKLIVEADGGQHAEAVAHDSARTAHLESLGYKVVRFWNHEILGDIDSVLEHIHTLLINSPHPCPPPEGEGETAGPHNRVPSPSGTG